jgi:RNA-binding protein
LRLSGKQKRYLKGLAQNRKAVVTVGSKGLVDSVITEINEALIRHELLKIKLPALPREDRERMLASICNATGSDQVQSIGRMGVLFSAADPPGIDLPE